MNMRTKRVVLLSCHSLLTAGIQRLLQESGEMELSTVQADAPDWTDQIRGIAPYAVVVDCCDACLKRGIISKLLEEHSQTRIVALRVNDQGIDVYRWKRVLQADFNSLLEAILGKGSGREASI